ncbi:hypothetical protein [Mycolicibacterium fortuitum]|uniref:hypothetical protein n=1 Tax=Mycolicibacterium fortuitum TaxID=1766 RepID=UPI0007EB1382|nr:hypothetical protein [Mycolicibacterium fortuitum]MDG5769202.1 hypothetical protein [Mycolicibacterium fortuitum]MDV7195547.1 hypothetical protein [Mycolicibacterium fortuitum]NOQ62672.1 hypothetical protein [Mycolicibacterium fortuitum]OBB49091.1 hypothetical protein A5754_31665 [Mycolicibacterium fortuitum]OBB81069.1 hypothetical protein A5755_00245 [Mycolicibacterium fortuitum]
MNTDTLSAAPRPTAVELIAAEQLLVSHDATRSPHDIGEVTTATSLVAAAAAYMYTSPTLWPFDEDAFQPVGEPIGDLAKAGALIAAALDIHLATVDGPITQEGSTTK